MKTILPLLTLCALISSVRAAVKPNALFSDGAVLQQGMEIPIWGSANEGEKVSVTFDGETETASTQNGKWMIRLKPHLAGGPYTLTIAGENTITVNNVSVGEVWICAGQSNMVFPLSKTANAATEIPTANYPKLRMMADAGASALQPQTDLGANGSSVLRSLPGIFQPLAITSDAIFLSQGACRLG